MDDQSQTRPEPAELPPETGSSTATQWVTAHADVMFRYALTRLRDRFAAEEAVLEAFLAAIESAHTFRGASTRQTWLIGILRHKILDRLGKAVREQSLDSGDQALDALYDEKGMWRVRPAAWGEAAPAILEKREFWDVFRTCMDKLPKRLAAVFALRIVEDTKPEEVCKDLGITPTNLWVLLHRGRSRLRRCLEVNWFGGARKGKE